MAAVVFCFVSCTVFCADQATEDWKTLEKIRGEDATFYDDQSKIYDSLKDILEDQARLYAALLKNPKNQASFALLYFYVIKANWTELYGMPQNKYEEFLKKLRDFIGHVKPEILVNDTDLLGILLDLKERGLLRTVYEKVGKENFGKMVARYVQKNMSLVAGLDNAIKEPLKPEENDFIGYWNSLVIESQFDYFLNLMSKDTGVYGWWFFRDAPFELGDSIRNLLNQCIKKNCNMGPALVVAIKSGYYDIALFLIEKAPKLIDTLKVDNNAVAEGIELFIHNSPGSIPTQRQVEDNFKRLNGAMPKILKTHLDLVAIFEPLKNVKTASAESIKKAQEAFYIAYPHINSGGTQAEIGVNIDLTRLLLGVQWRDDCKDILSLLRTKALEKNITINLSKYTNEEIDASGLRDVFDGTYVPTRKRGASALFLDFASALSTIK